MSDFKAGGVPTPDYDSDDINYIDQKTEFTDDIFVYGDTYASSFNNVEISVVGSTLTFTVAGIGSSSTSCRYPPLRSYDFRELVTSHPKTANLKQPS